MTLLSIIIPAYNAEPYINELLDKLAPQIVPEVEVIVIDDCSEKVFCSNYTWIKKIRFNTNQGASAARNAGLDAAKGKYIAFIDADDLVSDDYINKILDKIKQEKPDYIYLSWKAFGGWNIQVKLKSIDDQFPPFNCCVWNRIYKRSMIGKVRFNVLKACAEDAQFIRDVHEEGRKKAFIEEYMYFYRSDAADSLTKRARAGKVDTKRIVYHLPTVTKDMTYLIDEFKTLDVDTEVILMTNNNEIPELAKYAMIIPPQNITGPELRGEPTPLFHKIHKPLKTQVLLYVSNLKAIGGIETWTYNFCQRLCDFYDIMVLCDKEPDAKQKRRLLPIAQVVVNDNKPIICDTAINCRVALVLPKNVEYKHKYQIVHTLKMQPTWNLADTAEKTFFVSEASRRSYDMDGDIIYNMTLDRPIYKKPLLLVSATRLSWEKGGNRIHKLASMMSKLGILFTWLVFTDDQPQDIIDGLVYRKPTFDIRAYIQQADWYISLSDQEAFGYSIVEALELGTPVLTTPIDVLPEIGFIEGNNGFTIPFNVNECKDLSKKLSTNLKGFKYFYNNDVIVRQWRDILGYDTMPTRKTRADEGFKLVIALKSYKDVPLNRHVRENEILEVPEKIAEEGARQGFYEIIA